MIALALCAGGLTNATARPHIGGVPTPPCLNTAMVPNVVGLTYDNAVLSWHAAGFVQPVISANWGEGDPPVVAYQSLEAGTLACADSAVLGVVVK